VASAAAGWAVVQSPSPGSVSNTLYGVAATSSTNAWAVGQHADRTTGRTLIEHWNGTAWTQVPSPSPGGTRGFSVLNGVAATSSTNAWAVGDYAARHSLFQTLIEHWNGTAWTQVPSPNAPGGGNELNGVAATSATNAWAVGDSASGTETLIEHWNGTAWTQVLSPNPNPNDPGNRLFGVAATSATNAWAVGTECLICNTDSETDATLIVHWNGTAWKQQPSPSPSDFNDLFGVAATSSTNAWAVGFAAGSPVLIVHWNGTAWKQQPSSVPGAFNAVAATSATNAWAVGSPRIVHWNGTTWKQQPIPTPTATLNGVAATSATNAWAVGSHRGHFHTLVLHCC
jgi:hypothetical protein